MGEDIYTQYIKELISKIYKALGKLNKNSNDLFKMVGERRQADCSPRKTNKANMHIKMGHDAAGAIV